MLLVSPTGSVHYRKRKIGIGIQWKGRRVTVIDSKPDHVVVLDRTTGAVLRELILGRSGTYHRNGRKRDRSSQEPRNRTAAGASENGFEGTSVAAFNRELGVSHNLIHQRFGSKEALWYVTVDWAFGQIADQLADVDGLAAPDPVEAMRVMVRRLLEVHSRHRT